MKKKFLKHIKYYVALLIMQIIGFLVILVFRGNHDLQVAIIITSTIGYVVWAIIHNYTEHNLTSKIVLEYVLFGAFGLIISLFFFK
jgi:hypothetical protein